MNFSPNEMIQLLDDPKTIRVSSSLRNFDINVMLVNISKTASSTELRLNRAVSPKFRPWFLIMRFWCNIERDFSWFLCNSSLGFHWINKKKKLFNNLQDFTFISSIQSMWPYIYKYDISYIELIKCYKSFYVFIIPNKYFPGCVRLEQNENKKFPLLFSDWFLKDAPKNT